MSIDPDFSAALEAYDIQLEDAVAQQLEQYAKSMWELNESLNLTRHTNWDLFVGRDLRDCYHLAPLLGSGEEVLDLGSGNGVPGIPLAIIRPDIDVALAESVAKRAGALNDIVSDLSLPVAVYGARGEDLLEDFRFTSIVSRAVGSLSKFCRWVAPHWENVDRLLLIKGPKWVEERGEARHFGLLNGLDLRKVAAYSLGDEQEEREGVILQISPHGRDLSRFQPNTH